MADPVTNAVAEKIVDSLFSKAKREIDYVRNCTKNVKELRDEAEKLKEMRGRIQQRIGVAKLNGETLLKGVQNWVDKADVEISKVDEFLKDEADAKKTCLRVCVNLGTLHHYGKMAAIEKTPVLLKQQEDGKTFEKNLVSVPTPTPGLVDLYQTKNLDDIDTHKLALGKVIQALKDESIQMVGIYGSGGVGKTTLAKEVAAQVKKNDLFAEIVFITISQTVDVKAIQKDVEKGAKRIMNGEKVLIVLDDIWKKIDLPDVGIPCGKDYMNCKILVTSRRLNVCEGMNVDTNFSVNTLTKEEAWVLFKRIVGERLEKDDDKLEKIAREVTKECSGLPLIIQAVGNTLKNKSIDIWEAALNRLKNHASPAEISPEISEAFTRLQLSYDLLESKEAKWCFLMCSMFKEDEIISRSRLAEYGVGLQIFDDLDSINDAKTRVQIAVDTLTSSGLLLSERYGVKMHDVVRDVALLIPSSSSDQGVEKFLVKAGKDLTEWHPRKGNLDRYTKISLMDNRIGKLPADHQLHFPHLDTFLIQHNEISIIPDDFFRGMKEIKVLDMSWNKIASLPQSLKLLTKLITLDLSFNESLKDISIVGELKELEVLKVDCTNIEVIPEEIGQLTNLRLLDADLCRLLHDVTPGVMPKLTCLEELYIATCRKRGAASHLCLMEISKLKWLRLRALHLIMHSDDCYLFPEGTNFETLPEFFIQFHHSLHFYKKDLKSNLKRRLHIEKCNFPFTMPIKKLFQVSDGILLEEIKDLINIIPDLYDESIDELKSIQLESCENVSCLVKTRDEDVTQTCVTSRYDDLIGQRKTTKKKFFSQAEEIHLKYLPNLKFLFDCPFQYISLRNLQAIQIYNCPSLLTVFPLSVAQGLFNLRHIIIRSCKSLMVVISEGEEQTEDGETEVGIHDANIVFPSLAHIHLVRLPELKSFYFEDEDSTVKYPSLECIKVERCPSMKRWGYGVHDMPNINYFYSENLRFINDLIAVHHETNCYKESTWKAANSYASVPSPPPSPPPPPPPPPPPLVSVAADAAAFGEG